MADEGFGEKVTGLLSGIPDFLKSVGKGALNVAPEVLLSAGASMFGNPEATAELARLEAHKARARAHNDLQAFARMHGLLGKDEPLPAGVTIQGLAAMQHPKQTRLGKPGDWVTGPDGKPTQLGGAAQSTRAPHYIEKPGMPIMRIGADGKPEPVMGLDGKPMVVPRRPEKATTKLTSIMDPKTGKPHRVVVNEAGAVISDLGEAPVSGTTAMGTDGPDIAKSIMDGKQPPLTQGLYRFAGPVRAELARSGYDLSTAQRDWTAIQKHISTLQGPQQERLRQAVTFAYDSLDQIDSLYDQWKTLGNASGYKVFNRAKLEASKQVPGELGAVAQTLDAQIADLTSELGTVYKGGNSSTDDTLKLAAQNLSAAWNETAFNKAMKQVRINLRIRRNSILQSTPVGVSPNSPYLPPVPPIESTAPPRGPAAPAPAPGAVTHRFDPATGKIEAIQ